MLRSLNRKQRVELFKSIHLNKGITRALNLISTREDPEIGLSNEALTVILTEAWSCDSIAGGFAVFGCDTLEYAIRLRHLLGDGRDLHIYDSFDEIPVPGAEDYISSGLDSREGEDTIITTRPEVTIPPRITGPQQIKDIPIPDVIAYWSAMEDAGGKPAITHPGSFVYQDCPYPLSFILLDAKLYAPTMDAIELALPNLAPGGKMMVRLRDDEPGVEAALDSFDLDVYDGYLISEFVVYQKGI
jgi:hypothetical protein